MFGYQRSGQDKLNSFQSKMFVAHEKTLPRNYMTTTTTIINKLGRVECTQTLPYLRDREFVSDRSSPQEKQSNAVQGKK